jgi:hypothetical protein
VTLDVIQPDGEVLEYAAELVTPEGTAEAGAARVTRLTSPRSRQAYRVAEWSTGAVTCSCPDWTYSGRRHRREGEDENREPCKHMLAVLDRRDLDFDFAGRPELFRDPAEDQPPGVLPPPLGDGSYWWYDSSCVFLSNNGPNAGRWVGVPAADWEQLVFSDTPEGAAGLLAERGYGPGGRKRS